MEIKIVIVEDHLILRTTWRRIFNADSRFHVLGDFGTAEEAIPFIKSASPDVVLMDINLPGMNGVECTTELLNFRPATRVVCVSMHRNGSYIEKILEAGAIGYVTKTSPLEEIFDAIHAAADGRRYVCKELTERDTGNNYKRFL